MIWKPQIDGSPKPKYLALVDALESDIATGRLRQGERLPPQRNIASALGVTIATVTRAFGEASRRGLVSARTGSGTFVKAASPLRADAALPIDLALNTVPSGPAKPFLDDLLADIARDRKAEDLFSYQPALGTERHRRAMAGWFEARLPATNLSDVSLTHGAQHGLSACFGAFVRPGDTVLTEMWTYTGVRRLAATAQARLEGVEVDAHGLCPAALAEAFGRTGARLVICSSAVQNPTTATMPLGRREEILEVCRRFDGLVIEDDIYGRLSGDTDPTLAMLDPSRVVYVSSVSKSVAPGMRLGLLASPPHLSADLQDKLVSLHWTAPSFFAELFTRLFESGAAARCLHEHQREIERRLGPARALLGNETISSRPSYHVWLKVPPDWGQHDIVACLLARGVRVSPSTHFLVEETRQTPDFVRICLGAAEDVDTVSAALRIVAEVWSSSPRLSGTII